MAVTINAKGTSVPYFKIGKSGTTFYQGDADPSNTYTINTNDIWFDTSNGTVKFRVSNAWSGITTASDLTVTGDLTVQGTTTTVNSTEIQVQNTLKFEGSTSNDFETTLTVADPTADRIVTIQNATHTLVGRDTTDTLTNKSIDLDSNTISGSLAEFNTAMQGDSFVSLTGTETLTNKTLTSPVLNGTQMTTTGAIVIPTGTTAQRPGSPTEGEIRYNSTLDQVEVYKNGAWERVGDPDSATLTNDTFDGDGSDTTFTLSESASTNTVIVTLNGVVQVPTTDYTVSGTTLTFTTAPVTGDKISVKIFSSITYLDKVQDADSDTKIEVERTADDDIVYIKVAGSDKLTISSTATTHSQLVQFASYTTTQRNALSPSKSAVPASMQGEPTWRV